MEPFWHVGLSNAAAATLLALLAAVVSLRCRRPALVHGLWLLVLLKLVTPPLVRIPIVLPTAAAPAAAQRPMVPASLAALPDVVAAETASRIGPEGVVLPVEGALVLLPPEKVPPPAWKEAASAEPPDLGIGVALEMKGPLSPLLPISPSPYLPTAWDRLLLMIWVTGSAGWFLLAAWRVVCFHRLLRHAWPAPAAWQRRADELARDMGLAASPPLQLVLGRLPPMLWAVGRTRLLLPAALLEQVGPGPLEALLAHELAHLCRRDHWVRVLEFVTLGLYWWLPVAWYACRRLREAEEQCCDAWVVATLPGSGKAYADAILDTLDFLSSAPAPAPVLASGLGQVTDLKRRLRMIMKGTTPRALTWRGCAAVLTLGLLSLPLLPTWGQGEPGARGEEKERPRRPEGREPKPEEVEKARAELQHLQEEVNKRAAELTEVGKRMHEAARKLGALGVRPGPSPPGGGEPRGFILRKVDNNWVLMPLPPDGGRFGPREGGSGRPVERGPDGRFDRRPPPEGGGRLKDPHPGREGRDSCALKTVDAERRLKDPHPGREGRPEGSDRIEQLERRLEAVMRQLEEIRRELGPRRGPGEPPRRGAPPRRDVESGEPRPERKPLGTPPGRD